MAENSKNWDRFFKPRKVRTVASDSIKSFPAITGTGSQDIVDISGNPLTTWTLQVVGVDAAPTLWEVVLEGSADGENFSDILKHDSLVGDGIAVFSGTTLFLASYYRVSVNTLTLGAASSINVSVIGRQ